MEIAPVPVGTLYASVADFYRADPRREHSPELDFGAGWAVPGTAEEARLSWVFWTSELYLSVGAEGVVQVIGHAGDELRAEALLSGWADACRTGGGPAFLRARTHVNWASLGQAVHSAT